MVGPPPPPPEFSLTHYIAASLLLFPLLKLTVFPSTSEPLYILFLLSGTSFLSLYFLKVYSFFSSQQKFPSLPQSLP